MPIRRPRRGPDNRYNRHHPTNRYLAGRVPIIGVVTVAIVRGVVREGAGMRAAGVVPVVPVTPDLRVVLVLRVIPVVPVVHSVTSGPVVSYPRNISSESTIPIVRINSVIQYGAVVVVGLVGWIVRVVTFVPDRGIFQIIPDVTVLAILWIRGISRNGTTITE